MDEVGGFLGKNGKGLGGLVAGGLVAAMFGMGPLGILLAALIGGLLFGMVDSKDGLVNKGMDWAKTQFGGKKEGDDGQTVAVTKEKGIVSAGMGPITVDGTEYNVTMQGKETNEGKAVAFDKLLITRKSDSTVIIEDSMNYTASLNKGEVTLIPGAIEELKKAVSEDIATYNANLGNAVRKSGNPDHVPADKPLPENGVPAQPGPTVTPEAGAAR